MAVLKDHLHLAAIVGEADRVADALAVEDDLALVRVDELHQQPRRRRLAAAALAHDAQRLALLDGEVDAVDRAHHALRPEQAAALDREVLDEAVHRDERLRRPAAVARVRPVPGGGGRAAHWRTSMALRSPSEKRLKAIEVTKIMTPGNAATIGLM